MAVDKVTLQKLRLFAGVFRDAADRGANESDTVMYLVKFFEDVLGYNSLLGEISKEVSVKDRYCDFGVKLEGAIQILVEAKAASNRNLRDKDIEQAENYASRSGLRWVLLTNGLEWRLYHLTFAEGEGIVHDLAFCVKLVEDLEANADKVWSSLELLSKPAVLRNALDVFWNQKKALAPASLVKVLFSDPVLAVIRREVNRNSDARVDLQDVFNGVRELLTKEALLEAGEITLGRRRKKRRRPKPTIDGKPPVGGAEEVDKVDDESQGGEPLEGSSEAPGLPHATQKDESRESDGPSAS